MMSVGFLIVRLKYLGFILSREKTCINSVLDCIELMKLLCVLKLWYKLRYYRI